jgi:hypothetical protein
LHERSCTLLSCHRRHLSCHLERMSTGCGHCDCDCNKACCQDRCSLVQLVLPRWRLHVEPQIALLQVGWINEFPCVEKCRRCGPISILMTLIESKSSLRLEYLRLSSMFDSWMRPDWSFVSLRDRPYPHQDGHVPSVSHRVSSLMPESNQKVQGVDSMADARHARRGSRGGQGPHHLDGPAARGCMQTTWPRPSSLDKLHSGAQLQRIL